MTASADDIILNMPRGSNLNRTITLDAIAGDITSWTFSVFEVIPLALAADITCAVIDGPNRVARLQSAWGAHWPIGTGKEVSFRIKPSGLDAALPRFVVNLT